MVRSLVLALALLAFAIPAFASDTARMWRLGWIAPAAAPGPNHQAFLAQMKQLGYEEGRNLHIDWTWGGQRYDRLPELAAALVQRKPDVIVSQTQAASQAIQKATKAIPIVFVGVRDPVVAGLVETLARPGANITGVTLTPNAELAAKQVELLRAISPRTARIGVMWNPDVAVQGQVVDTITEMSNGLRIVVRAFGVSRSGDIERAFEAMRRERIEGLITLVESFTLGQRALIARLATDARIPTSFEVKDYVKAGGLLSYGVAYHEHYAQAAIYVDRIFRGAKPSDLPVQQPAKLEMAINLRTAKALRVTVPPEILIRADEVIE